MGGIGTLILIFVGSLLFVGMIGVALYFLKKNDPDRLDSTNSGGLENAQDFLPFVDIKDQMIHMGNNVYHTVVEVSSVNYALRNDREKDIIELSFQGFLNGLTYPITLFISTREMDYTKLVQSMKDDYEQTYADFPQMREYLQQNLVDMQNLSHSLGETRHKKKYVIIPYDSNILTELDDEEKYEATKEILFERAQNVQSGLQRITGINTKVLKTIEIIDLFVQTYHRDGSRFAEDLQNGNLTNIIVDGQQVVKPSDFTSEELYDIMLNEMQSTLESKFLHNNNMDSATKKKADQLWKRIHDVRQSDDLDGMKYNHEREREKELERKLQNGEVTYFGTDEEFNDFTQTEENGGREIL